MNYAAESKSLRKYINEWTNKWKKEKKGIVVGSIETKNQRKEMYSL